MEDRLKKHLDDLFANAPDTEKMSEIKEEILQNTVDRYNDLIAEGKTEEEAYGTAIGGIGDLSRIIGDRPKNTASDEDGFSVGSADIAENINSIDINWLSGSVRIEVFDGGRTELRETGYKNEAEKLRYKVSEGRLTVRFAKRFYKSFIKSKKDLTVKLPRSIASGLKELRLESVSAKMFAGDLNTGDLNVESVSGRIDLVSISAARSNLKSVSGSINASGLKTESLKLNNVSGSAEVWGDIRQLCCDSVSGRMTVSTENALQSARLNSVSGGITLNLPSISEFTARLGTVSGCINSDFACTHEGKKLVCGDGRCKIDAETVSGNLNIRKNK